MKVDKKDYKYVPKHADADFDADRNRRIVDEVIEETEKIQAKKRREASEKLEERTDALAQYLHSVSQGGVSSNITKYFGRRELLRLKGEALLRNIRAEQ